ncbi:hypothetical protein H4S01_003244 [Coemansia sp. RSA 2610]|nr:hypothetical protein H4S01_003244 [Coemansia sp. RSA 2610]
MRGGTLKAFVRVSKNADGLVNDKPAMRMTRSRSAALKAEAAVPAATPTRKRKLAKETEAVGSPAKRVTRAKGKKGAQNTIRAYFGPKVPEVVDAGTASPVAGSSDNAVGLIAETAKEVRPVETEPVIEAAEKPADITEPVIETAVEPAADTTEPVIEAAEESADTTEPINETAKEPAADTAKDIKISKAELAVAIATGEAAGGQPASDDAKLARTARANVLLKRLRSRKRPDADAAAIEETRAIQDAIRARREQAGSQAAATPPAAAPEAASFSAAHVQTADERQAQALKRQFVRINARVDGALPRDMRRLESLFQALEHTLMFGGGSAVYHTARAAVEAMARHTFGWRELGQILAVYPEAYTHTPQPATLNGRRVQSVLLTPVARGMALAVEMEARRDEFKRRLVARVADAHSRFLLARGYSADDVAAVDGWHPSFDIETTPHVSPLPLPPTPPAGASAVAAFDREKLRHLIGGSRAEEQARAESKVAALPTPTDSPLLQPALAAPKERPTSSASALLERIRAKQRAKAQAAQQAPAVPPATRSMYARLPDILGAISFLYYSERKHVLPLAYVADKLCEGQGLDSAEAVQHMAQLAEFVPEWCTVDDPDPKNPGPDARLRVTRAISAQEARSRLSAKINERMGA